MKRLRTRWRSWEAKTGQMWIDALKKFGVLAEGCKTTAYTYLGAELTWDIYWNGTIGEAKKDLDKKAAVINDTLSSISGEGRVSVLKAVVSASSAIPIMPAVSFTAFKVMKEKAHTRAVSNSRSFVQGKFVW